MATAAYGSSTGRATGWIAGAWEGLHLWKKQDPRVLGLIDQFFSTLAATYQQIKCSGIDLAPFADITAQIEQLLAGERSWRNAYHIEQLMVPLYSGEKLDIELQRRLLEAEKIRPPIGGYYNRVGIAEASDERKRSLLARLVNDLQWRYENRQVEAYYRGIFAQRTSMVFVCATLLFLVLVLIVFFNVSGVAAPSSQDVQAPAQASYALLRWQSLILFTAMASGVMGAAFSMLLTCNTRANEGDIEDLRAARRWTFILSRAFVGIGASLILYYLIASRVLDGVVFPDVEELFKTQTRDVFRNHFALLIVACFLAGFSERLVPNLLARTEKDIENRQAPPRPTTTG